MFRVPKGYEEFCKPTFLCESDSVEIKNLSRKIIKNSKTKKEAVKSIFLYVRDRVKWDIVEIVGAKELLKRRPLIGICVDKVNLFIALCRSIGIPARYLLIFHCELRRINDEFPKVIQHVAAEIYLNGKWRIVDPTFGHHTQKLIPISEFERPSWKKIKYFIRLKEFTRMMKYLSTFFLNLSPSALKMKNLIKSVEK